MAPKKNDDNTAKKTPRKRVVKPKPEKPKLKTPTVLRIKIPVDPMGPNGITPKLNKNQLIIQRKIELANEVALAQLSPAPIVETPQAAPDPKLLSTKKGKRKASETKDGPKKTKNKKKITFNDESTYSPGSDSDEGFEQKIPPKKKPRRKPVAKKSALENKDENSLNSAIKSRGRQKLKRNANVDNTAKNLEATAMKVDEAVVKVEKPDDIDVKVNSKPGIVRPKPVKTDPKVIRNILTNGVTTRSLRRKAVENKLTIEKMPEEAASATLAKVAELLEGDEGEARVLSRKASVNSNLSWTHDISTSSTTTCVTVTTNNDFVRFDKKLPVIQITGIEEAAGCGSSSSSSSSGSSSSSRSSSSLRAVEGTRDLNLSASLGFAALSLHASPKTPARVSSHASPRAFPHASPHSSPHASPHSSPRAFPRSASGATRLSSDELDHFSAALDRLASSLRGFEAEASPRSLGPRTSAGVYDVLKHESDAITHCRNLRRILGGVDVSSPRVEFARPAPPRVRARPSEEPHPTPPAPLTEERSSDDFTSDRVRYTPFDQSVDDDDALSLFAESITGFDSSRVSASVASARASPPPAAPRSSSLEEYVPAPVAPRPPEPRRYRPTRIPPPPEPRRYLPACFPSVSPVCEKQSADSTSVREAEPRETDADPERQRADSRREPEFAAPASPGPLAAVSVASVPPVTPSRSAFFRGLCFYNVASQCRFEKCRFPHADLSTSEVARRAAALSSDALLREWALARAYPALKRRLAPVAVQEFARRGLTRALLEVAPALRGANVAETQAALEAALLHLTDVDLAPVEELLERPVLDSMLRALAETQNFSRFRGVFAQLARLAGARALAVPADVAGKILERVTILPGEGALARAMAALLALTDARVYQGDLVGRFEAQLAALGGDAHSQFLAGRERAVRRSGAASFAETKADPPPLLPEREERYTSPDTTHYDALNNLPIAPMITRIVDLKRSRTDTTLVTFNPTVPPPQMQTAKNFRTWHEGTYRSLRRPDGVARSPNGSAMTPNGSARTPNGMRLMRPNMRNRRTIKRRPIAITYGAANNYQHSMSSGDFYD